jgi:hypothetical protein
VKKLKSRYSLTQVNNNNYSTISVGTSTGYYNGSKGTSSLEQGYIWVPYIISSSPGFVIESNQEMRKSKIRNIIDKL